MSASRTYVHCHRNSLAFNTLNTCKLPISILSNNCVAEDRDRCIPFQHIRVGQVKHTLVFVRQNANCNSYLLICTVRCSNNNDRRRRRHISTRKTKKSYKIPFDFFRCSSLLHSLPLTHARTAYTANEVNGLWCFGEKSSALSILICYFEYVILFEIEIQNANRRKCE